MEKLPTLGVQAFAAQTSYLIKSTRRESFTYGSHPRQQLDLYTPSNDGHSQNSLFIFLYGGGLVRGDRINPNFEEELVYANVGHFFAENLGCKVVVPDYRLISHQARFPSGGEDLELVIKWVREQIAPSSKTPLDLYILGNSAGGIHLSTYLLAPQFAASRQDILGKGLSDINLRGVILLAVPFHFDKATADRAETLSAYYGNEVRQRSPLGLLRVCKEDGFIGKLKGVSIVVATGSLDPQNEILLPNDDFVKEWHDTGIDNMSRLNLEGHNHISPVLSLGTGLDAEERWGKQVIDFISNTSLKHD